MRIYALESGQLVYNLQNSENRLVRGVGTISGSTSFTVGADSEDRTQLNFYNNSDNGSKVTINTGSTGNNNIDSYTFNGDNYDLTFEHDTYNAVIKGSNSTVASQADNRIVLGEDSSNNWLNLGWGKNQVVDSGDYNLTTAAGTTTFATTETSYGAIAALKGGDDNVILNGSSAVVTTGYGHDNVIVGATGSGNIVSTGADGDTVVDNGTANYFNTGSGNDNVTLNGLLSRAELGSGDETYTVTGQGNIAGSVLDDEDRPALSQIASNFYEGTKTGEWIKENLNSQFSWLPKFPAGETESDIEKAFYILNGMDSEIDSVLGSRITHNFVDNPFDSELAQKILDNFYDEVSLEGIPETKTYDMNNFGMMLAGGDNEISFKELASLDLNQDGNITDDEISEWKLQHLHI